MLYYLRDLKHLNTFYDHCMVSEPDILEFDCSQLLTTLHLAQKIINSLIPPIPTPTPLSYTPPPSTRFKPPRMVIPQWSGKNYEFYTWLSACSISFEPPKCPETARTQMMCQAMPFDKTPQFNNISDWAIFKKKLISKFGGIPILVCKAHSVFNLIPVYKSHQELAEYLAPKINYLESIIECMEEYIIQLKPSTTMCWTNIIRSLPIELRIS